MDSRGRQEQLIGHIPKNASLVQNLRWLCSACDHHFLIKPAEERLLADTNAAAGEPFGDFVAPQIERKGFQFRQQRSPNVAQRMPPSRKVIIDNDDLSTWLYDATKFAEGSLAILAGLLMQ